MQKYYYVNKELGMWLCWKFAQSPAPHETSMVSHTCSPRTKAHAPVHKYTNMCMHKHK